MVAAEGSSLESGSLATDLQQPSLLPTPHRIADVCDSRLDEFRALRRQRPPSNKILVEGRESVALLLASDFVVCTVLLQPAMLAEVQASLESRAQRRPSAGPGNVLLCDARLLEEVTGICISAKGELAFAMAQRRPASEALVDALPQLAEDLDKQPVRLLALDGLTDASNVGALLRVAVGFRATAVLCSGDCCDPFHPKAIRASLGRAFHIPVIRGNLPAMLRELRERWSVLTAAAVIQEGARFLDEMKEVPQRWAIVVGSEHFGVSQAAREACGLLLKIRMAPNVDSLNVVVSAGVLLHGCVERETSGAAIPAAGDLER